MAGGDRGGVEIVVKHRRRFRCWRETLLSRFEEMPVVVGIIRVSLATRLFVIFRGAFVKEVILDMLGGRETCFKLGVLGG